MKVQEVSLQVGARYPAQLGSYLPKETERQGIILFDTYTS